MDVTALEGQELTAVEFVADYLRLRFAGPMVTMSAWPHLLFPEFSLAYGEPEYRNGLCAQIGEIVASKAGLPSCDEATTARSKELRRTSATRTTMSKMSSGRSGAKNTKRRALMRMPAPRARQRSACVPPSISARNNSMAESM